MVLSAFVLGAASIYLLPYARIPFEFTAGTSSDPVVAIILRALFRTAMPENSQDSCHRRFALRRRDRELPMDGLVVGGSRWTRFRCLREPCLSPSPLRFLADPGRDTRRTRCAISRGSRHDRGGLHRWRAIWWRIRRASAWSQNCCSRCRFCLAHSGCLARYVRRSTACYSGGHRPWQPSSNFCSGLRQYIIGFGTIAFAVRLRWRVAEHERFIKMRPPARDWRAIWGVLILGGGAGFVGAAMIATGGFWDFMSGTRHRWR